MKGLFSFVALSLLSAVNAYWLMGIEDFITTERLDPIVNPGKVSGHVHSVLGGSNFRFNTTTAQLRQSECTSVPIPQDKSSYWFPHMYFQWKNGSVTSLNGGAVIYYLFSDTPGTTTAFPDDFRMISGDPTLRSYDPKSFAQQAVTFLCLDFDGKSTTHNEFPAQDCPSGIRAQINFPSCWDGKNTDSVDHKSHVAFLSEGADKGTCSDPKFPVTLPRIFMEVYWSSHDFSSVRNQAMNTSQPFVFAHGDSTGYGYHADFLMGWDKGVLQNAVDKCHCNPFGDATCCVDQGIFDMNQGKQCHITKSVNEQTTGTLAKLPGNNPVTGFGPKVALAPAATIPAIIGPVVAYTSDQPPSGSAGKIITPAGPNPGATAGSSSPPPSSSSTSGTGSSSSSSGSGSAEGSSTGASGSSVGGSSSESSSSPSNGSSGGISTISTGGSSPASGKSCKARSSRRSTKKRSPVPAVARLEVHRQMRGRKSRL